MTLSATMLPPKIVRDMKNLRTWATPGLWRTDKENARTIRLRDVGVSRNENETGAETSFRPLAARRPGCMAGPRGLGQLSVVRCPLSVVRGQWSVVSGQWSVVSGQWSVVDAQ